MHDQAGVGMRIDFQTEPSNYRHWTLRVEGRVAELTLDPQSPMPVLRRLGLEIDPHAHPGSIMHYNSCPASQPEL